jgi:hypothetical protein
MSEEIESSEVENTEWPTVHWSLVQLPLLKDMPAWILDHPLKVSQKVLLSRESIKRIARHPEVVVYDKAYVEYILFQCVCSLIVDVIVEDYVESPDTDSTAFYSQQELVAVEALTISLTQLMRSAIEKGVQAFRDVSNEYSALGGEYGVNRANLCKAYKLAISKEIKAS